MLLKQHFVGHMNRSNRINLLAWFLLVLSTSLWTWISFWGPDTHSEINEAPSFYVKLRDLIFFFFLVGGVLLPIKNVSSVKLNYSIIISALVILAIKSLQLTYNLIFGAGFGDLKLLLILVFGLVLALILLISKVAIGKKIIKSRINKL